MPLIFSTSFSPSALSFTRKASLLPPIDARRNALLAVPDLMHMKLNTRISKMMNVDLTFITPDQVRWRLPFGTFIVPRSDSSVEFYPAFLDVTLQLFEDFLLFCSAPRTFPFY